MPVAEETTGSKLKHRKTWGDRAIGDFVGERHYEGRPHREVEGRHHADQQPNIIPEADEDTRCYGVVPQKLRNDRGKK
jgi:hypothetical protein